MVRLHLSFILISLSSSAVIPPNSKQLKVIETLRRSMDVEIVSENAKAVFNTEYCHTGILQFEDFFCGEKENAYVTKAYLACLDKYPKRVAAEQLTLLRKMGDILWNIFNLLPDSFHGCDEKHNEKRSDAFSSLFNRSQWPDELKRVVDPEAAWPEALKLSGTYLSSAQCSFGEAEIMLCNNRTIDYGIMVKFLNILGDRQFLNIPEFMLIDNKGQIRSLEACSRTFETDQTFICNRYLTTCELPRTVGCAF